MKFIVAGLGNFGSALALKLAQENHEVIGIDCNEELVNELQDELTHTIRMDSTNETAILQLPLDETDVVIVAIGEDLGASMTATALFKKHCVDVKIIARAISQVHRTILEAMDVDEIVTPEAEFANQFANRLMISGTVKSFLLDDTYEVAEFAVPPSFIGKSVDEVGLIEKWQVSLITVLSEEVSKNVLGKETRAHKVQGVVNGQTVFKQSDQLVLFGLIKSLRKMMNSMEHEN